MRDQEVNRQFFEDLLGIPLVATWCEKHHNSWLGRDVAMCHTFFSMADGGALAFFAFGDPEIYKLVIAEKPPVVGSFDHVAFKVSDRTYDEIIARLQRTGEKFRETDHGYCKSVYATSPDGLIVEFTVDPPGVETDRRDPPRRRAFRTGALDGRRSPHQQRPAAALASTIRYCVKQPIQLSARDCSFRHADAGRHPRLAARSTSLCRSHTWMPTCVGMTLGSDRALLGPKRAVAARARAAPHGYSEGHRRR